MPPPYALNASLMTPRHRRWEDVVLPAVAPVEVAWVCRQAGIRYRVTGGSPPIVLMDASREESYRTLGPDYRIMYVVGTQSLTQEQPEYWFRILEILAYGFNDYGARESVCRRGFFKA